MSANPIPAPVPVYTEPPSVDAAKAKGATHFKLFRLNYDYDANKVREEVLSYKEGATAPRNALIRIDLFGEDFIREEWGSATYMAMFYDETRRAVGKVKFALDGVRSDEPEEEEEGEEEEGEEEEEDDEPAPKIGDIEARHLPRPQVNPNADLPPAAPRVGAPSPFSMPAPMPAVELPPVAPLAGVQLPADVATSLALFHHLNQINQQAIAQANRMAELQIQRYQIDAHQALERERMNHDRQLASQQQFFREVQKTQGAADPMDMLDRFERMLDDKLDGVREEIDQKVGMAAAAAASQQAPAAPAQEKSMVTEAIEAAQSILPMVPDIAKLINGSSAAVPAVPGPTVT